MKSRWHSRTVDEQTDGSSEDAGGRNTVERRHHSVTERRMLLSQG